MKNKLRLSDGLLIVLIILENLFLYYFYKKGILTQGKNAISLFISSLLFGIVLIYKFYNAAISLPVARPAKSNIISYCLILLVIVGLIILGVQCGTFIRS